MKSKFFLLTALLSAIGFTAVPAHAVIIVNEQFNDGDRDATDDDGAINDTETDVNWFEQNTGTAQTVNAQAESAITGNGLFVDSAAAQRPVLAQFSPQTLTNTGDTIALSFDFRLFSGGTTATSTTPAAQGADTGFRFGLFNTDGSSPTADGTTASTTDFGYRSEILVGTTPGTTGNPPILSESGTNGDILSGTDSSASFAVPGTAYRIGDTAPRSVLFTIIRTDTGVTVTQTVYNDVGLSGGVLASTSGDDIGAPNNDNSQTGVFTTFDLIAFNSGGVDFNYRIDNVQVEMTAIPEPSSVALAGLGLVGLAVLVRRRNRT